MSRGDSVAALRFYTEAISATPRDHALFSNRAFAFTRLKQLPRALADADEAVRSSAGVGGCLRAAEKGYSVWTLWRSEATLPVSQSDCRSVAQAL